VSATRIRVLPDQVANQIAAGEVIERPASVLKELVENCIDAKATRVNVEIRGGGKSLIRVTDDGVGMNRDDALLCLERHATSKIHDSADIGCIHTLGFRGEALPSIASVSRFRLLTRSHDDGEGGTEIEIHGGKIISVKDAGCASGTMMEVRNLFYNLPARRKFLRSDATELGHLHHAFFLHALAQPAIGWQFRQEDRLIFDLPAFALTADDPASWSQALMQRIKGLHGNQLASQLLPVDFKSEGISIRGFLGKPGFSRSNRSEMYCFVNTRPVDSRAVYYGLVEGYHTALMRGRYPISFLFLEVEPASVDVNIHPAKREVRFREDARVQGAVVRAARKALGISPGSSTLSQVPIAMSFRPSSHRSSHPYSHPQQQYSTSLPGQVSGSGAGSPGMANLQPSFGAQPPAGTPVTTSYPSPLETVPGQSQGAVSLPNFAAPAASADHSPQLGMGGLGLEKNAPRRILGVVDRLYVVIADGEGLQIIDQHAAHERILFEKMMNRLGEGVAASQKLLIPQTVELSPTDSLKLKEHLPVLERMGFGVSEFGRQTFLVDALPPLLSSQDVSAMIRSLIDQLGEAGRGINRERFAEEIVAKTVCRHAVKANDDLRPEELAKLVEDLYQCQHPLTCPHGRPTVLRLTKAELERRFGRRPLQD
jgi:DNA mismatch repair protein MutL